MTETRRDETVRVRGVTGSPSSERQVIGWREWVALPDLRIALVKAKIDTGARTSSLHAYDVEEHRRRGRVLIRFRVHPDQRSAKRVVDCEAPLVDYRKVKSSSGQSELRPVVLTAIEILGKRWNVELTLTRRDEMGFRMLLGRQALRGGFVVDPQRSFLNGRRAKGKDRLKTPVKRKRS